MYYKDCSGANSGGECRKAIVAESREFELFGPLHVDFFFQPKYLVSNVPMRLKINRTPASFYMVKGAAAPECKVQIMEAVLWVRRVQVSPSIELAHTRAMHGGKNAVYPMHRGEIEVMSVPPQQQTVTKDNMFMSRLPKRLILCLVRNDVFNGLETEHSYTFGHFGLQSLEVSVDGENVCGTPLYTDFGSGKYMRAYDGLFHAMNKSYS